MNGFYIESITNAVDYIENNLNKRITLAGISEASGLSKYHFHNIFMAYTGCKVFDAVTQLRLEKASELLTTTSKTVKDIAILCGFSDPAEFGKEFRRLFSISPSAFRKNRKLPVTYQPLKTMLTDSGVDYSEAKLISSKVAALDGFTIAYIRHNEAYAGDSALFIYLYNKLTTWAGSKDLLGSEQQNVVLYHHPEKIAEESRTRISIGISVPIDTKTSRDIGKINIDGGDYLVSRFSLRDEDYGKAWNRVYRDLLPELKLKPADGFSFELYPTNAKSDDRHSSIVDIYIPVIKT
ncbi:MAG: AraC family transcriptional regulator [Spirochaetales bacterium]|uniref:AraC family transcriptional regulator n=1 Tax=Candidatus Thalassospirochaeta sargassi TaxID=3119039 RepID=A0AAJ1IBJ8_9SPIO|nr:AraC family transcriptional regulator [Spirochaetales bacterium]